MTGWLHFLTVKPSPSEPRAAMNLSKLSCFVNHVAPSSFRNSPNKPLLTSLSTDLSLWSESDPPASMIAFMDKSFKNVAYVSITYQTNLSKTSKHWGSFLSHCNKQCQRRQKLPGKETPVCPRRTPSDDYKPGSNTIPNSSNRQNTKRSGTSHKISGMPLRQTIGGSHSLLGWRRGERPTHIHE